MSRNGIVRRNGNLEISMNSLLQHPEVNAVTQQLVRAFSVALQEQLMQIMRENYFEGIEVTQSEINLGIYKRKKFKIKLV